MSWDCQHPPLIQGIERSDGRTQSLDQEEMTVKEKSNRRKVDQSREINVDITIKAINRIALV